VAKVNEVEEIQRQRQAEMQPKAPPAKTSRKKVESQSPKQVKPPDFKPPSFPPPQPTTTAEPPKKKSRPSRPPTTKSLDELLAELNDSTGSRPVWFALNELQRLPVQENRKVDVAPALNRHLQSADTITANAAAKAAITWGTEQNGDALLPLIDSPHALLRWDAMRALAKVRPTAETAELLLAQAGEVSNGSALRDAMKELGPVGEQTLLDSLAAGDSRAKQALLRLLSDTGSPAAIPVLEKMIQSESDFVTKSQAESALRRIQNRKP
jgi:hypothetical protein